MKIRNLSVAVYVLCILSLLLPWFTYNGAIMGYCRGIHFLSGLSVPLCVLGFCLVKKEGGPLYQILSELCILSSLVILILAFGLWEQVYNIRGGFHWDTGLHTVQLGYWISLMLFSALTVLVQIRVFGKGHRIN